MKTFNLKVKYPQNYIIRKPVFGALVLFVFSFGFVLLYQPLNAHKSDGLNFEVTMVFYSLAASFSAWFSIIILKKIRFFSNKKDWSILKEFFSMYLVLQVMGISIFLSAFIIESPIEESRWNLITIIDSFKYGFLIGIIPFAFFTAMNFKHRSKNVGLINSEDNNAEEEILINISSKLKKESLSLRASDLLFVKSDGNYVVFYLYQNNKIRKILIRNSISNIEKQLSYLPIFFRCHRAYIVNIDKVFAKKGNALGYLLSIKNCGEKIPVSRQNVKEYDTLFPKFLQ